MASGILKWFPAPRFTPAKPFGQNPVLKTYCLVFAFFWVFTGVTSTDLVNWLLENTLTLSAVVLLIQFHRIFPFSLASYTVFLLFLLLHLYGSQNAYAENPFGFWLKTQFDLTRNHYDRIVHFSFGLLMSYPTQEMLVRLFGTQGWRAYVRPVELALSLSAFYEIVEWLVADVFFPKLGMAFLGAQGDIWDAQKDMFLASLGGGITMLFLLIKRSRT